MFSMIIGSLLAPLAVAGISALFAALISVTDSIVNNYGECAIDINEGQRTLNVKGGANMLITLAEQDIFIPSACGGRGSCGECKVKVNSDVGPILPTELPYLDDSQRKENVRLSCQNKVRGDLAIQIPEWLFNCRRCENAVVEKIVDVTHDIKEIYLRLPEGEEIDFVSGQYAQLEVPPYGKVRESTQRAYSMASKPSDRNQLEFLVRLVPDGILTTYVHQRLKEGDTLSLVGPFGEFHVRDSSSTMICVAGGSGMAPFKAIIKERIEKGTMDQRDIWYFFGAVKERDMYYVDWLNQVDEQYSRFHFVPALSDPDPDARWQGEVGLITEVLDRYLKEQIPSSAKKEGYLCGSPGMLDACMAVMRTHNMHNSEIYFDKFS